MYDYSVLAKQCFGESMQRMTNYYEISPSDYSSLNTVSKTMADFQGNIKQKIDKQLLEKV